MLFFVLLFLSSFLCCFLCCYSCPVFLLFSLLRRAVATVPALSINYLPVIVTYFLTPRWPRRRAASSVTRPSPGSRSSIRAPSSQTGPSSTSPSSVYRSQVRHEKPVLPGAGLAPPVQIRCIQKPGETWETSVARPRAQNFPYFDF